MKIRRKRYVTRLRVSLDCEPIVAQVAFAAELIYGSRVIVSDFLLLGVVANAHADVVVTTFTVREKISLFVLPKSNA